MMENNTDYNKIVIKEEIVWFDNSDANEQDINDEIPVIEAAAGNFESNDGSQISSTWSPVTVKLEVDFSEDGETEVQTEPAVATEIEEETYETSQNSRNGLHGEFCNSNYVINELDALPKAGLESSFDVDGNGDLKSSGTLITRRISNQRIRFSCAICQKSFKIKQQLKNHMVVHSCERPYSCSYCLTKFKTKATLKTHLPVHSTEKQFCCLYCNKTFRRRMGLKRHIMLHSNERPYSCSHCQKVFRHKNKFKSHLIIHTDEKQFSCSSCYKTFKRRAGLKQHMLIHSSEKPYSCSHCQMTMKRAADLKQHMLIHTDVKPFSCLDCKKTFRRRSHLKTHLVFVHDKKNL